MLGVMLKVLADLVYKTPGLQKKALFYHKYFHNLCKQCACVQGGIIEKAGLIFKIQQTFNLKEDDSPPANNKVTRILGQMADGSLKQ